MFDLEQTKRAAHEVGFDLCGVAQVHRYEGEARLLEQWIAEGNASSLGYLARNGEVRTDATRLVEGARSVIVCAAAYRRQEYAPDCRTKVASYACARDYHDVMREMLGELCRHIGLAEQGARFRIFTDSAPIFEKQYAIDAGLGWRGRHSLLITPEYGSYVVLGEVVTDALFDHYDTPLDERDCGACRRCAEQCPNGAIREKSIDTRRCISCATIERESLTPTPLHGWIFGCDECQNACPHNRAHGTYVNPRLAPLFSPTEMDAEAWLAMSAEEFKAHLAATPLSRSGIERIKRNISTDEK